MSKAYKQLTYRGKPALIVPIRESTERWSDIELDDGSTIRAKLVITRVLRLEGQYDPDGIPIYVVQSMNVVTAESLDDLRKPAMEPVSEIH